jgi:hypothetical protein
MNGLLESIDDLRLELRDYEDKPTTAQMERVRLTLRRVEEQAEEVLVELDEAGR